MHTPPEEQYIKKLTQHSSQVRPSHKLLHTILKELPAQQPAAKQQPWFFSPFIPAGAGVFAALLLFIASASFMPSPSQQNTAQQQASFISTAIEPEQSISLASIVAEEQQIEEDLSFETFFQEEAQMQEIDNVLASF